LQDDLMRIYGGERMARLLTTLGMKDGEAIESRMGVLWRLRHKDSITLGDLAQQLDVSPRNITGLVDHLEQDALVERFPDAEDRRAIRVRLAPAGKQKLADIKHEMGSQRIGLVAGFTSDELQQLRHLCLKLVRNLTVSKELEKV